MNINVLVVEDNADHAESLRRILLSRTEVNYAVEVVRTLKDAVLRLSKSGIDAVLLDLTLADARGVEVIRKVVAAAADVGIVVLTGWEDVTIDATAKAEGANEILHKPASPVEISSKLQSVVIYRRYNKERHEIDKLLSEVGSLALRLGELSSETKPASVERPPSAVKQSFLSPKLESK